jgi:hypothetical protein
MAKRGDITRARSVKAEFDDAICATTNAGAVIAERGFRRLNLKRICADYLPERNDDAKYASTDIAYSTIAALITGGKGLKANEALRLNDLDAELFGLDAGLPTEGTIHNAMAEMAGLKPRKFHDAYGEAGRAHPAIDLFGRVKVKPKHRRIIPEQPEAALSGNRESLDAFTGAMATRCLKALPHKVVYLDGYVIGFGDATQLEVRGRCFDAAEVDRNGAKALQWATFMVGPVIAAQSLDGGAAFEAHRLSGLIDNAAPVIEPLRGSRGVLGLYDAAYFHNEILTLHEERDWKYIMSANLHRQKLEREIAPLNDALWSDLGPDDHRGWEAASVTVFKHRPTDWRHETRIVAIRYRPKGELFWRYTFFATNLGAGDLPKHRVAEFGFGQYVRMLYSTKQAREDHYKTPLIDLGLHHPPSSRLGINEVFYALASAASNIAMVLRYRVVKGADRGIRLWRLRAQYFRLAGRLIRGAGTLRVVLFGGGHSPGFKQHWLTAFGEASLI